MEQMIGRYLTPEEIVHHKGVHFSLGSIKNKQDDSPENLQLYTNESQHAKIHAMKRVKKGVQGFVH